MDMGPVTSLIEGQRIQWFSVIVRVEKEYRPRVCSRENWHVW